ncbi:hypothetical protein DBR32_10170 [Taibaiella sp. KBW10]|uniref:energy transducer TonB n=1 Tax=Taibaiella sp. KBW10 TaxID=2153357 RepID=UPI000F5B3399|nr:energy transducer TonB [Taibaiella sp. KBW10]RQO31061.1 hypothetical protein DBR32_10170 [Taibaiella sp. KBW10]
MKKIILSVFCLLSVTLSVYAQEVQQVEGKKFAAIERMPEPAFNLPQYLQTNIQYPEEALKNKVEGKVFLKFVVDTDGSLSNIEIVKGKDIGYGIPEEAIRVVKNMPKWKPAKLSNGQPAKSSFMLPVQFNIQ